MKHPEECIRCGVCVTVCPVEMVGGHAIVTFLADPTAREYSVWLCTSCWRCQESCPVNVDIYGLMMKWRREMKAPPGYRDAYTAVQTRGLAVGVSQGVLDDVREAWGLEPVSLPNRGQAACLLGIKIELADRSESS
jgi:L-lactate utilization protein LutB